MLFQAIANNPDPMLALSAWGWGGVVLGAIVVGFLFVLYLSEYILVRFNRLNFLAPFRIHFVPALDISWTAEPAVVALADQLRELGFVEAGKFEIPEM